MRSYNILEHNSVQTQQADHGNILKDVADVLS